MRPLPLDGVPPWRVTWWPDARKLVWTFHHALLDGRSITRILTAFQSRLLGNEDPGDLGLAFSQAPDPAQIDRALEFHRQAFARVEASLPEFARDTGGTPGQLCRSLGADVAARLEAAAARMESTAPTLVTWAWGQAVACAAGADAVVIGQVRSGPPQPGQAGFFMNTVPLVIHRAPSGPVLEQFAGVSATFVRYACG